MGIRGFIFTCFHVGRYSFILRMLFLKLRLMQVHKLDRFVGKVVFRVFNIETVLPF